MRVSCKSGVPETNSQVAQWPVIQVAFILQRRGWVNWWLGQLPNISVSWGFYPRVSTRRSTPFPPRCLLVAMPGGRQHEPPRGIEPGDLARVRGRPLSGAHFRARDVVRPGPSASLVRHGVQSTRVRHQAGSAATRVDVALAPGVQAPAATGFQGVTRPVWKTPRASRAICEISLARAAGESSAAPRWWTLERGRARPGTLWVRPGCGSNSIRSMTPSGPGRSDCIAGYTPSPTPCAELWSRPRLAPPGGKSTSPQGEPVS